MSWRREDEVRVQCYPSGRSLSLRIAGYVLIGAGIMLIIYLLSRLFNAKSEPMTSLLLSGAIITFVSPFSSYS